MYTTERAGLREVFFGAWRKYREGAPLEGIESLVVEVARRHPEYHAVLEAGADPGSAGYSPILGETNPFLHMGLHIALAEQLAVDQPPGVRNACQRLRARFPDAHSAEHAAIECLEEMLWRAQTAGQPPEQAGYLECLRRRAGH